FIKNREGTPILGVITAKPPHFLSASERDKVLSIEHMLIDVGARNRAEVEDEMGIDIGATIVPQSTFQAMHNPQRFVSKAFDNRVGMALAIQSAQELSQSPHPNHLHHAGSVQEEVGARGAQTLGQLTQPDVALVLEGPPADDLPGTPKDEQQGAIGRGVQLRLHDPTAIANPKLVHFVRETADKHHIPHQISVRRNGGTDARILHTFGPGVPTIVLGVPARYTHTANSIIDINDYLTALKLILALSQSLDCDTVHRLVSF
ncbi:MAG: M20/M25/M40 family metallo-hydrolase, partial [Myxococcota bacterium]